MGLSNTIHNQRGKIMSDNAVRDEIEQLLLSTKRHGINELLKYLDESDFYTAPASTQYHGSYEGGLAEHSLNTYNTLLFSYDNIKDNPGFALPEIPADSLIIAGLLHDICKVNSYVVSSRNVKNETTGQWEKVPFYKREPMFPMGHGGKSVFLLQTFMDLTPQEALAIFWHMGSYDFSPYNTANECGQAYTNNLLAFLLHQADMMTTYIVENELYQELGDDIPF